MHIYFIYTFKQIQIFFCSRLDSLREVHRAREAELRRMQLDMEMAKSSLESLENHATDAQLQFYRTMNIFSRNLLECLSEKVHLY